MLRKISGYPIVELMLIVVILLILASVALVRYSAIPEKGRSAEAYAVLADIAAAENSYYIENNAYTTTWANLDRYSAAPVSQNFDFSTALANVSSGYVKATHSSGTVDYYMCISGGRKGTSPPSCP